MTDTATIETRDQAHRWLVLHVRYSRYDTNFIDNVSRLSGENKALTKRQDELWERLVHKYRKQIKSNGWDAEEIVKLNWQLEPVDFDANYSPLLWYEDGELCCRFPYNQRVVKEIRAVLEDHSSQWLYEYDKRFQWSKERRCWHGQFHPALCKDLITFASDNEFEIDQTVKKFEEGIPGTEHDWMPVAEYVNDRVYVSNLTPSLASAFEGNELTPDLVRDLVSLGVTPSTRLAQECANRWGDDIAYLLCFREVSVTPDNTDHIKQYLKITSNNVIVADALYANDETLYTDKCNLDQSGIYLGAKDYDFAWPGDSVGNYILYTENSNETLKSGIDLVLTTSAATYTSGRGITNIAKKIIVVHE